MRLFLVLIVILFFSSFASAAKCAGDSFKDGCECVRNGGTACWEASKAKGVACMTAAYPVAVTKYWMGECKQMEKCINDLQSCIDSRCVGTDETKCITAMCINCHSMADECAAKASSCNNCGDGKCDKAAGEDQNTCCQDCGCLEDMVCKSGGLFSDPECKELATDGGPLCFPWFLGLPLVSLAASLASKAMCVG